MATRLNILCFLPFFFLVWLAGQQAQAQKNKVETLEAILSTLKDADTAKVNVLAELAWLHRNSDLQKSLNYGREALRLADKLNFQQETPKILIYIGVAYRNQGDYPKAMGHFLDAAKRAEKMGNKERLAYAYQSMGDINNRQGHYDQAIEYVKRALVLFEEIKDKRGIGYCYHTMGQAYQAKDAFEQALDAHQKALKIRQELNDKNNVASSMSLLGTIWQEIGNFDKAKPYLDSAQVLFLQLNDQRGLARMISQSAKIHLSRGELDKGLQTAEQALSIAEQSGNIEYIKDSYKILSQLHAARKDFDRAYLYQSKFIIFEDSLLALEKNRQILELQSQYDNEKQQMQISLLEESNRAKDYLQYFILAITAAIAGVAFLTWRNSRREQKANTRLLEQSESLRQLNAELNSTVELVNEQKKDIEDKNRDLTSGINYASRIQRALLPQEDKLRQHFADAFILFRPRDIVSGDFYFYAEKSGKQIVAAIDCTGHGVPGAFMSMIANDSLHKNINLLGITSPEMILYELHRDVRAILKQDETDSRDGMDITVCVFRLIPKEYRELIGLPTVEVAAAKHTLFYIQDGQGHEVKGDRTPIGGIQLEEERVFSKHVIEIDRPTSFYLFSDGYQDQFGGPDNRKFMIRNFRQLLLDIHDRSMAEQDQLLQQTLDKWMRQGNQKQMDDVLVVGLKVV